MLDGPPCMKRKITRLALAGKFGGLGARGFSGLAPVAPASRDVSPSVPNPQAVWRRMARREMGVNSFIGLVDIDKFVGCKQDAAEALPGLQVRILRVPFSGDALDVIERGTNLFR